MRTVAKWGIAHALAVGLLLGATRAPAEENERRPTLNEWVNKYHDANTHYVIFPNGQIFAARAKRTGLVIGRLNLWHCFRPVSLRYRGDENIYLTARVVDFLDDDGKDMAARYKTQCALNTYPGDPYQRIVPHAITNQNPPI